MLDSGNKIHWCFEEVDRTTNQIEYLKRRRKSMLYKSEVTGKDYKTIEELEAAEHEVELSKTKAEEEKKAKQAELVSINEAASAYLKLVEDNKKLRADLKAKEEDAYEKYQEELDNFAKKHNGYHLTYKVDGTNVEFEIKEANFHFFLRIF